MSLEKFLAFKVPASELTKNAIFSGTLSKQDKKVGVIWRKRFCVLMYTSSEDTEDKSRYGVLYLFTSPDEKQTKSKIDLRKTVKEIKKKTKKGMLKIEMKTGRCFYFSCEKYEELEKWGTVLEDASKGSLPQDASDANDFLIRSKRTHKIQHTHLDKFRRAKSFLRRPTYTNVLGTSPPPSIIERIASGNKDTATTTTTTTTTSTTTTTTPNASSTTTSTATSATSNNETSQKSTEEQVTGLEHKDSESKISSPRATGQQRRSAARSRVFSLQKPPNLTEELEPWMQWGRELMHYGSTAIKFPFLGECSGKPKRRYIALSKDGDWLQWGTSKDINQLNRKVHVSHVKQIIYGPYSLTMNRYAFSKSVPADIQQKVVPWRCISIVVSVSKKDQKLDQEGDNDEIQDKVDHVAERTLDFQFNSDSETLAWFVGLQGVCTACTDVNIELSQFKWTKLNLQMEQSLFEKTLREDVQDEEDYSVASMVSDILQTL